jgi:nucleotide-binding universal stress UspA family protein
MSYRTILVHIGRGDESDTRLAAAIRLARAFGARLVGAYLVDEPEITPSVAALLPEESVARRMREGAEAQHAAEQAFREAATAAGCSDLEWRAPSGSPIDAAVAHGRCADLIIVGQPDSALSDTSFSARLVSSVLLETGRPMLVVPSVAASDSIGSRVLVAWDSGREATRALADALPFLARADQVTVVSVDPGASQRGADGPARQRLAAYLQSHGIVAEFEHHELGKGDIEIGDWLLSRAADWSIDLLVMGGYGHSRWRERVLGGATRSVLSTMTVCVLMSH